MPYSLGVDLGTTYTAAAIRRGERLEIADLGTRSAAIPSVVYLRDDGTVLTGEAATRRGATDPGRLAREFKRRMGDTTAILLGGVPYSVDGLMASMLRSVVATVTERQGEAPEAIAIAHPANWGQYKKDLLVQAVKRADLDGATMITEPEAAAVHYATLERLDPGSVVAVYDLGGGTFDAAVLRKTEGGFELIGEPEGIERLGGIDFDEAVFRHVVTALRGAVNELDPDDPVAQAAVSRLRDECVAAKEALSSDTEVSIPVILPNVQTEVRLTRAEFEAMIRPALGDTLVVLNRSLRSAGVTPADLHSVLLVGGSSRIPLIAQLVGAELGRPVALDVHPKHSVALGAAALAGGAVPPRSAAPVAPTTPTLPAPGSGATQAAPVVPAAAAAGAVAATAAAGAVPPSSVFPTVPDLPGVPAAATTPSGTTGVVPPPPTAAQPSEPATAAPATIAAAPVTAPLAYGHVGGGGGGTPPDGGGAGRQKRTGLLIGAGVVIAAALGVGGALAFGGGDGDAGAGDRTEETDTAATDAPDATTGATDAPDTSPLGTDPADTTAPSTTAEPIDPCEGITLPCIVIESARVTETGAIEVVWTPRNFVPSINEYHAHLYWNSATAEQASNDSPDDVQVGWDAVDATVHTSSELLVVSNRPEGATGICAAVGLAPEHNVPNPEIFHCVELPELAG